MQNIATETVLETLDEIILILIAESAAATV